MVKNKIVALFAASSISVLGAGTPALVFGFGPAPLAQAQTDTTAATTSHRAVHSGQMKWGVKESFRNYITGNIAKGSIRGTAPLSGGQFTFTAKQSSMSGKDTGVIAFDGEVQFVGHNDILNLTLKNIRLKVKGNQAQVYADAYGREFIDTKTKGDFKDWKNVPLATMTLTSAPDFTQDTVRIQSAPNQSVLPNNPQALEVFGKTFYKPGTPMDGIDVEVSLRDESGPAPSLGLGSEGAGAGSGSGDRGATRSNATEGPAYLLGTVNDTLVEINGLMVNTDNVLTNAEKLANRRGGNPGTTGAGTSGGTSPTLTASEVSPVGVAQNQSKLTASQSTSNAPVGGGTAAATPRNSTVNSGSGGAAAAPATAGGGSGAVCADNGSRGVQNAQAAWGVRQSFRNYIRGTIAKGNWQLSKVSDSNGTFQWSGNQGAVNVQNKSGSILFPGATRFTGHDGILDTRFSNLEIQFSGNSGKLIVNATSNDTEGNPHDYGRVALADLAFSDLNVSEGSASGTATATLTAVGAEAFAHFYPVGDALDPISFTATLGGKSNCAQGQGDSVSASATGQGGSADQAAALRSGSGTNGTAGTLDSDTADSVFNEVEGVDSVSESKGTGESQFQIKNSKEEGFTWDDSAIAQMLTILASFVTAGGVLTHFATRN